MHCKNSSTILLQLDEDFHEERIDEVNELLGKQFSKVYRMVNWI